MNYDHHFQSMTTANRIKRQQKDFQRVSQMRGAMPIEASLILIMGKTAMDKKS